MSHYSRKPARKLDTESGIPRVSGSKGKKSRRPPSPESSDSEEVYVDSDLEQELEIPAKDDSVRKKKKAPKNKAPARVADHGVQGAEDSGSELAELKSKETSSAVAPHMQLLLAATYHLGFSSIVRPALSTFYPSCYNMFSMVLAMANLTSGNTYLNEMAPGYTSIALYVYYGFVYYYQILRAKDEVGMGQLSRTERRVLRQLKSIGEPENWPIASPLIEFVRALGYYKSSNPAYSYVVPALVDTAGLVTGNAANQGLARLNLVGGIHRMPPMPALLAFLRNFGNGTAQYRAAHGWLPINAANGHLAAAPGDFLNMTDSTAATGAAFQALAFNHGWNEPTDGELRYGPVQQADKRNIVRRWNITNPLGNYSDIEQYTQLMDNVNTAWIRHLLAMMNVYNRFFPGSTNLGAINPVSHLGNLTNQSVTVTNARVPRDHVWYRGRQNWHFTYKGYDDTEQGRILSRIGLATGVMMNEDANVNPAVNLGAIVNGPFFQDAPAPHANTERHEVFRFTGSSEQDPVGRFDEQLAAVYDPTGGRN